ncbi:MAG TPA: hypothetical protein DC057_17475, partial [Spirochaetia bacterium]|nr:hypothetical protein [Spirochaetia bacterium]
DLSGDITSLSVKGDREILDYKIIENGIKEKDKTLTDNRKSLQYFNKQVTKYSNRLRNFSLLYINDGEGFSP